MLKGQAALLWGVLGEAHTLLAPSRDPTNLEAAAPTTFLRGAATEGARGRWSKLGKQLQVSPRLYSPKVTPHLLRTKAPPLLQAPPSAGASRR